MKKFIKKVKLREYKDKRGLLVENILEQIVCNSKHFFISKSKPGTIRGNHYHKRKIEWFYLIQGVCKVSAVDLKTNQKEVFILKESQNLIINFKQNIAHVFKNIGKNEMILLALVNEVHNQQDPDTYTYKIF